MLEMAKLTVYAFLAAEDETEPYSELRTPGTVIEKREYAFEEPTDATYLFDQIKCAFERAGVE